jgi:hypothetical protein
VRPESGTGAGFSLSQLNGQLLRDVRHRRVVERRLHVCLRLVDENTELLQKSFRPGQLAIKVRKMSDREDGKC